jgi:hypothetical protein
MCAHWAMRMARSGYERTAKTGAGISRFHGRGAVYRKRGRRPLQPARWCSKGEDALAAAYRLKYLAAGAVEEVARLSGDEPSAILQRLVDAKH